MLNLPWIDFVMKHSILKTCLLMLLAGLMSVASLPEFAYSKVEASSKAKKTKVTKKSSKKTSKKAPKKKTSRKYKSKKKATKKTAKAKKTVKTKTKKTTKTKPKKTTKKVEKTVKSKETAKPTKKAADKPKTDKIAPKVAPVAVPPKIDPKAPVGPSGLVVSDKNALDQKNLKGDEEEEKLEIEEEIPPEYLLVDFRSLEPQSTWIAKAFEMNISHDIYAYPDLRPLSRGNLLNDVCPLEPESPKCLIDVAHKNGAILYLEGILENKGIRLNLYQTWNGAIIDEGFYDIKEGKSHAKIKLETFKLVKPLLSKGGILDQVRRQREVKKSELENMNLANEAVLSSRFDDYLSFYALLLLLPIAYRLLLALIKALKYKGFKSQFDWVTILYSFVLLVTFFVFALLANGVDLPEKTAVLSWIEAHALKNETLLSLVSGILWSIVAAINLDFFFRPLYKMEEMPHNSVKTCVKGFVFSSGLRMFASLVFHLFIYNWFAFGLPGFDPFDGPAMVLVPSLIVVSYIAMMVMVEYLSFHNDLSFAKDDATIKNETHASMSAYLAEKLDVYAADLPAICKKAIFLKGRGRRVITYGGPFLRPRIVIGETLLEESRLLDADTIVSFDEDEENVNSNSPLDFLYGALLAPFSLIYRRSHWRLSVLNMFMLPHKDHQGELSEFRFGIMKMYERYCFLVERLTTDAFAVSVKGYHNLVQYLYYLRFDDDRLLSQGADHFALVQYSEAIVGFASALHKPATGNFYDNFHNFDTMLHHLVEVSNLYQGEMEQLAKKKDPNKISKEMMYLKRAMIALPILMVTLFVILQGVDYRAVYNDRLKKEQQVIDDQFKKKQEDEKNLPPKIGAKK